MSSLRITKKKFYCLLLTAYSALLTPIWADSIGIAAKIPEGQAIVLGEPFALRYQITLPREEHLDLSPWKAGVTQWGDFTLWDFSWKSSGVDDKNEIELSLKLIPFALGKSEIPAIEIPCRSSSASGKVKFITTPPLTIDIGDPTQGIKDSDKPRDIKAPRKPLYFWEHPMGIALLIFLALIILGSFFIYKSRRKRQEIAKELELKLTPEEAFYKGLNNLEASGWFEQKKYRECYFVLSEIFRNYLERRFLLNLDSLTTREILKELSRKKDEAGILSSNLARLREVYEIMDFAKFAKYAPTAEETSKTLGTLRDFVESHHPKPTAAPQEANA